MSKADRARIMVRDREDNRKQRLEEISKIVSKITSMLENKSLTVSDFGKTMLQDTAPIALREIAVLMLDKDKAIKLRAINEHNKLISSMLGILKDSMIKRSDDVRREIESLSKEQLINLVSIRQRDQAVDALFEELDKTDEKP